MGAYYTAFNHDKRELLDPDSCDGNSKQTSVVMGEFANLLAFDEYANATEEELSKFKARYRSGVQS